MLDDGENQKWSIGMALRACIAALLGDALAVGLDEKRAIRQQAWVSEWGG
jgi:hypothetical protein